MQRLTSHCIQRTSSSIKNASRLAVQSPTASSFSTFSCMGGVAASPVFSTSGSGNGGSASTSNTRSPHSEPGSSTRTGLKGIPIPGATNLLGIAAAHLIMWIMGELLLSSIFLCMMVAENFDLVALNQTEYKLSICRRVTFYRELFL
ncbi:hypothetical protein PROFUN_00125 [Planoprotostelium fungivorum]|uniref:Uncharacterized protein n=1 Tax=Planoprotostelium fungivorum TaxID=1890364 RepID=A0A2P6P0Q3_9EUKA|nr:hypothetical protein PROFUN_00125 [Planoprotostelium fungivorum]